MPLSIQEARLKFIKELTKQANFYSCLIIVPLGLALNVASIAIFKRKPFRKKTIAIYNIIIALVNNVVLILSFLNFFTQSLSKDFILKSNFGCVFFIFTTRVFTQASSWLNVLVTVDRMILVSYPCRFSLIQKRLTIFIMVFAVFVTISALNVPNLMFKVNKISNFNKNNNKTETFLSCTANDKLVLARDLITIIIRIVIPFVLMIKLNGFLIYKIVKSRRRANHCSSKTQKKDYYFAVSIITLNILFLLTQTPLLICLILLNMFQYSVLYGTSIEVAWANFFYTISLIVSSYNYAFTFLVNLKYNRLFRSEFMKLVCFLKRFYALKIIKFNKVNSSSLELEQKF